VFDVGCYFGVVGVSVVVLDGVFVLVWVIVGLVVVGVYDLEVVDVVVGFVEVFVVVVVVVVLLVEGF